MSYRAGIYGDLAAAMGVEPGGPWVACDGCGTKKHICGDRCPPAWLLDNRAAPGWRLERVETPEGVRRRDYCPACRNKPSSSGAETA